MDGGARTEETELIAMLSISRRNLITLGASLGASFFAAGALAGCGDGKAAPGSTGASGKTGSDYKVGVLQLVEHGALDQTNKGFVAALDESGIAYTIDQQNAQNDQSACQTIASKLVNDGDDLIRVGYRLHDRSAKRTERSVGLPDHREQARERR